MEHEPSTEELKALQAQREESEAQRARTAPDEQETAQHQRRSDKARYLREKLEQRAESERESEREQS